MASVVIVSSKNPVKIGAARQGFAQMFPGAGFDIRGLSVPSGVPDQPFSDQETLDGATNRANNARAAAPDADYWVGIEGGVDDGARHADDPQAAAGAGAGAGAAREQGTHHHQGSAAGADGMTAAATAAAGGPIESFAWVVVVGKDGRVGRARTAAYYLPEETAKLLREGMELGHADDLIHGRTNSKQHSGSVGILTDDAVDRAGYYTQAVVLALIPFKNPKLTFT
ncbi:NTPase [Purpureocillium lavendulum]|uniref:inosine/xanthosine triphosphatase n=1 Tax=Purpureocillium lavendulum TaxID=1247861 RepID=A0AB34FVR7_9HYPO|nr:NTPase [Purpureocillium lavendulum]